MQGYLKMYLYVSLCIFMYLSDRGAKIQKDTFGYVYLNVSFCIFPLRSERYIKIHLDTLRYIQIHRPHKIVRTNKKYLPNWSLEFEFSNSRSKGGSDSLYVDQQSANWDQRSANADQRSPQENACR